MSKQITLRQLQDKFPTEASCLDHLFRMRYGTDFACPKCERPAKFHRVKSRRSYECQWCAYQVYPTAGTPFDRTRTSLRDWFYVMFLFTTTRNGVAAKRVEREIGVTYKTAWRMCHEIRKHMASIGSDDPIGGFCKQVEVDETLIGGPFERGKRGGDPGEGKTVVFGMMERRGEVRAHVVPDRKRDTLFPVMKAGIRRHSTVHTDDHRSYLTVAREGFYHSVVNHSAGEYAKPSLGGSTRSRASGPCSSAGSTAPTFTSARSISRNISPSSPIAGTCVRSPT